MLFSLIDNSGSKENSGGVWYTDNLSLQRRVPMSKMLIVIVVVVLLHRVIW